MLRILLAMVKNVYYMLLDWLSIIDERVICMYKNRSKPKTFDSASSSLLERSKTYVK